MPIGDQMPRRSLCASIIHDRDRIHEIVDLVEQLQHRHATLCHQRYQIPVFRGSRHKYHAHCLHTHEQLQIFPLLTAIAVAVG